MFSKSALRFFAIFIICLGILFAFASCGEDAPAATHTHTYANEWSKDSANHWHAATCEHTTAICGKAAHTFGDWSVKTAATCGADGVEHRLCVVCGYEETRSTSKTFHTFGSWTVKTAATCGTDGVEHRLCSICGYEETRSTDKIAHTYSSDWTTDESYHWHAATCNHTTEVSGKAAHTFGNWSVKIPETCGTDGVEHRLCSICGYEETRSTDKIAHPYSSDWTTDESYHWHAATCNHTTEVSGKAAHTFGNWSVKIPETCGADGVEHRFCTICNYEETRSIDKIAHTYSSDWTTNQSYHWHAATCEHTTEIKDKAVHTAGDWMIDTDPTYEADGTKHKSCTVCGLTLVEEEIPKLIPNKISFNTLTVDEDDTVFGKVPNTQTTFSFIKEVAVSGTATYVVSTDIYGMNQIPTKTVPLSVGNNTFYVLETVGSDITLYTVTIRRKPIYTVTFDTAGGTAVSSQQVEEDAFATEQTTTRTGYTFVNWDYNFAAAITADTTITASWTANQYIVSLDANQGTCDIDSMKMTYDSTYTLPTPARTGYTFDGWFIGEVEYGSDAWAFTNDTTVLTAKWTANTNTPYVVKHYQQNLDNDEYTLFETKNYTGTSDATVTATLETYSGFTAPEAKQVTINPDGTSVVEYYYTRNTYTLTFVTNGGNEIESKNLKYNASLESYVPEREGYTFGGWFSDANLSQAVSTMPANDLSIYVWWAEETKTNNCSYVAIDGNVTIAHISGSIVTIPSFIGGNPVTSIASCAFGPGLTSITIPKSVQVIGRQTFDECSGLKTVTFEEGSQCSSIGEYAFPYCTGLTSITIPKSVQKIGGYAFNGCSSLKTVTFEEGSQCSGIGSGAFLDCASLTSIIIPKSVQNIGSSAFYGCTGLKTVTFEEGSQCSSIGSSAFSGCTGLTSITIPDSVTSIRDRAFYGCTGLTSITIPNSVESIGSYAFYHCISLTSVTFNGTKAQWNSISKGYCWSSTDTGHYPQPLHFKLFCSDGTIQY